MKLPQWKSTAPVEHYKASAQLRSYVPQHSAPKMKFIPAQTAQQAYNTGMRTAAAYGEIGNALSKIAYTVQKSKEVGEVEAAKTRWLDQASAEESRITQQPHEIENVDDQGNPILDAKGNKTFSRPWETGLDDWSKSSKELEKSVADQTITSETGKRKFALWAAGERAKSGKRIQKWQIGHQIDRANATFIESIDNSKTHMMVDDRAQMALQSQADPAKIEAARRKAHQRITSNHVTARNSALALTMRNMSPDEFDAQMDAAQEHYLSVEHTLTAGMNEGHLRTFVSLDKEYYGSIRKERQAVSAVRLLQDMLSEQPDRVDAARQQINSPYVGEVVGDAGTTLVKIAAERRDKGYTTPAADRAATLNIKDLELGVISAEEALYNHALNSNGLNNADFRARTNELTNAIIAGAKEDAGAARKIIQVATVGTRDPNFDNGTETQKKENADYVILTDKLNQAIKQARASGVDYEARDLAIDILSSQKLPPWAVTSNGEKATSLLDVDFSASKQLERQYMADAETPQERMKRGQQAQILRNRKDILDNLILQETQ